MKGSFSSLFRYNACFGSGYMCEMTSGKCLRIQRNSWFNSEYMFMFLRDPKVESRPVFQGRDLNCTRRCC